MSQVFSPGLIGKMELKNRLIHSATFECMAEEDGSVTEALIQRYETLAKGGVGLIVPGYFNVHPRGKAVTGMSGLYDDRHIPGLGRLTSAVHEAGGRIAIQIAHGGRQSPKHVTGTPPLAPSSFGRDPVSMNKPQTASEEDILEIIRAFALAARRAVEAGADAVQLHAAHGYLLNEFLSPFFNRRQDQWGGTPENMFRIMREIVAAVRGQTGPDLPLLVKMNVMDFTPKPGITLDLAAKYAGWLAECGINGLEISGGTYYTFHTVRGDIPINDMARPLPWWMKLPAKLIFKRHIEACRFEPLYHQKAAEVIKPALGDVPLLLVGGVRTLEEMERVLAEGRANFLSMSRPFIREPFLAKRMMEGKTDRAACISCNKCFAAIFNGLPLRCYVNGLPV